MKQLDPIVAVVRAPRVYVFQALTAFGQPSLVWFRGREPELVEEDADGLVVRFYPRLLGRVVPTLQRVRLHPPSRITYEHLDRRFGSIQEAISLTPDGGSTLLEHRADFGGRGRFGGRVIERIITLPALRREMQRSLDHYRVTIEAAARASGLAEVCVPATTDRAAANGHQGDERSVEVTGARSGVGR